MTEAISSEKLLGQRVRAMRVGKGWTLDQASKFTGLARSTLSKIENGQMSPTYDALIKLAAGFETELAELFAPQQPAVGAGRLSASRNGTGEPYTTPHYHHVLLCPDLSNKDMVPFRSTIIARDFDDFDDWSRHDGEEFVYVLEGRIRLYTQFYEPMEFGTGDSWYIDSRMGHRVITISEKPAEVLWMSTTHPKTTPNLPA